METYPTFFSTSAFSSFSIPFFLCLSLSIFRSLCFSFLAFVSLSNRSNIECFHKIIKNENENKNVTSCGGLKSKALIACIRSTVPYVRLNLDKVKCTQNHFTFRIQPYEYKICNVETPETRSYTYIVRQ